MMPSLRRNISPTAKRNVTWAGGVMTELVRQRERAEALRGRLDELRGYL